MLELDDDADDVIVLEEEDDGRWVTVVDLVAELVLDSDVLFDRLEDTLMVADGEMDNVGVAVGDHVTLSLTDTSVDVVVDTESEPLTLEDGDSMALKLAVALTVFDRVLVGRGVGVGDGARERVAVDDALAKKVLLAVLLVERLRVGSNSTVKLLDMLMDIDTLFKGEELMELVAETRTEDDVVVVIEMDSKYDADDVGLVDNDEDGMMLTVSFTVTELLVDSDILRD